MTEKVDTTPAEEVKDTAPEVKDTPAETPEEPTLQDLQTDPKPKAEVPDQIPYHRFQEKVDEVNTLKDQIKELETKASAPETTDKEVASDLAAIAKEHNLDEGILGQIAGALESRLEAKVNETMRPITEAEARKNAEAAFEKMYTDVIGANPDYESIANKDVIKQLAFLPENSKLTLSQLLEKTYGGSVQTPTPTPTLEKDAKPRGGPDTIQEIDFDRAQKDSDYFQKIKSDPTLLKKYNDMAVEAFAKHM